MFRGKKYQESAKQIDKAMLYDPKEGLELICKTASAKFDETVELHVKLGVDSRHADQQVRGAIVLPNGTGKSVRVLVFAKGDKAEAAKAAGVIVDYKGITVAEDTALRAECRNNNVEYAVIKNTLLRFAFNNCGLNELDDQLNGTTSLAICADDPVAPARVIADYAKKLKDKFEIKGGFMDGKVVSMETVNALASIPALPVLQAQVLGTMLAPISALACVLKQIAEKDGAAAE